MHRIKRPVPAKKHKFFPYRDSGQKKFLDIKTVESEAAKELVSSLKHALDSRIISVGDNEVLNVCHAFGSSFLIEN
jgi:hypothetical protein